MRTTTMVFAIALLACGCGEPRRPATSSTEVAVKSEDTQPDELVGIWRWQWTRGTVHHLQFHPDGRAEKYEDADKLISNGTWHVDDNGELIVKLTMRFRIDDDGLMDIETIPTDRDFPWTKVDRVSNSLTDD